MKGQGSTAASEPGDAKVAAVFGLGVVGGCLPYQTAAIPGGIAEMVNEWILSAGVTGQCLHRPQAPLRHRLRDVG